MLKNLPSTPEALLAWTWPEIEPYYDDLASRPLSSAGIGEWLTDWTRLGEKIEELYSRLSVATSINTADCVTGSNLYSTIAAPSQSIARRSATDCACPPPSWLRIIIACVMEVGRWKD